MTEAATSKERIVVCRNCGGNGFVPLIPAEWTRPFAKLRLDREMAMHLRDLLHEDRDQFFEEKRSLEASGKPSYQVLQEIRALEKILRAVDGLIGEERWDDILPANEGQDPIAIRHP